MDTTIMMTAREIVTSFVDALNLEDFKTARDYVNENMTFIGSMGTRDGAEAYFNDMEHMKLKYEIKKTFTDGDDVCLLYDIMLSGINVFSCGWYHIEQGKIKLIRVIFDPRPILEQR